MPLKEAQSQTRERWALTTHVCSDLSLWPQRPPLEALFKGGRVIGLRVEAALQRLRERKTSGLWSLALAQLALGPKESYIKEHTWQ